MLDRDVLNRCTVTLRVLRLYLRLPTEVTVREIIETAAVKKGIAPTEAGRMFLRIYKKRKILPPFMTEMCREVLEKERKRFRNGNGSGDT